MRGRHLLSALVVSFGCLIFAGRADADRSFGGSGSFHAVEPFTDMSPMPVSVNPEVEYIAYSHAEVVIIKLNSNDIGGYVVHQTYGEGAGNDFDWFDFDGFEFWVSDISGAPDAIYADLFVFRKAWSNVFQVDYSVYGEIVCLPGYSGDPCTPDFLSSIAPEAGFALRSKDLLAGVRWQYSSVSYARRSRSGPAAVAPKLWTLYQVRSRAQRARRLGHCGEQALL